MEIVIFSNQRLLSRREDLLASFKRKVEDISKKLNVELHFFASILDDSFRKPAVGMWEEMIVITGWNIGVYDA